MKIILCNSGASGAIYFDRLLNYLSSSNQVEKIAIVQSPTAKQIYKDELKKNLTIYNKVCIFENNDFNAPIASGSSLWDKMVVLPCSIATLSKIANSIADNLICRSADVMLKERRKLIICPRETPYNLIHIRNMETLTLAGAIICPCNPSFYSLPQNIDELVDTVVFRILDLLEIKHNGFRWGE